MNDVEWVMKQAADATEAARKNPQRTAGRKRSMLVSDPKGELAALPAEKEAQLRYLILPPAQLETPAKWMQLNVQSALAALRDREGS